MDETDGTQAVRGSRDQKITRGLADEVEGKQGKARRGEAAGVDVTGCIEQEDGRDEGSASAGARVG